MLVSVLERKGDKKERERKGEGGEGGREGRVYCSSDN